MNSGRKVIKHLESGLVLSIKRITKIKGTGKI